MSVIDPLGVITLGSIICGAPPPAKGFCIKGLSTKTERARYTSHSVTILGPIVPYRHLSPIASLLILTATCLPRIRVLTFVESLHQMIHDLSVCQMDMV